MRQRTSHRRGWTLIELVGVVAMTSVLMGVAMSLLHAVVAWSNRATSASTQAVALHQLEQDLRQQLRYTTSATADGEVLTLIAGPGIRSTWTLDDGQCTLRNDKDGQPSFERYAIGPRTKWDLVITDNLAEVRLEAPDGERGMPFRVVAALEDSAEDTQP